MGSLNSEVGHRLSDLRDPSGDNNSRNDRPDRDRGEGKSDESQNEAAHGNNRKSGSGDADAWELDSFSMSDQKGIQNDAVLDVSSKSSV